MAHLLSVSLKRIPTDAAESFPFCVPAVRTLPSVDLDRGVTFFVGENGSGKSTLLEGIAACAELPAIGSVGVDSDPSLSAQRELGAALRLAWKVRSRRGFFLRAEDFFGYLKAEARTDARILRERQESAGAPAWPAQAAELGSIHIDEQKSEGYLRHRDKKSHGESFMEVFAQRVRGNGLYLLDEPEAPLSVTRQLALIQLIGTAARSGAQFIIATHSPILLALPGARILSFDRAPIRQVAYEDLENVRLTRDFLANPERFLRELG